eukprot:1151629-Pelagomonas_calceolata.AAC.2
MSRGSPKSLPGACDPQPRYRAAGQQPTQNQLMMSGKLVGGVCIEKTSAAQQAKKSVILRVPTQGEAFNPKAVGHKAFNPKAVSHKAVSRKAVSHKAVSHKAVSHKAVSHKAVSHKAVSHKAGSHKAVSHKAASHKAASHKAVSHTRWLLSDMYKRSSWSTLLHMFIDTPGGIHHMVQRLTGCHHNLDKRDWPPGAITKRASAAVFVHIRHLVARVWPHVPLYTHPRVFIP